jgi:hypothetical protein
MIDNSPTPKFLDMERFVAIILGVVIVEISRQDNI